MDKKYLLNLLEKMVVLEGNPNKDSRQQVYTGDSGDLDLIYAGDAAKNHEEILFELYNGIKEVELHISMKTFRKEILNIVWRCKSEARNPIQVDLDRLINYFKSLPTKQLLVLSEIKGLDLSEEITPYHIGGFQLYTYPNDKEQIASEYPGLEGVKYSKWEDGTYLIGITLNAKDRQKAYELALKEFERFENIFNYILADLAKLWQVRIVSNREFFTKSAKVLEYNSKAYMDSISANPWHWVNLSESNILKVDANLELLNLLSKELKTEMEKRIITAADWIGKAVVEVDPAKSLVQFIFALECLFQENSNELVSPSITYQISEALCFIIGKDLEDRMDLKKTFTKLYRKRSNIVHGSDHGSISNKDLLDALMMSKGAIKQMLLIPELKILKSYSDLKAWVEEKKFT